MNDIEQYGEILKKDIITLINNNDLQNARKIVNDYEELIPYDIDVYSIKGVIAIMEENMNESEKILKEGISIIEDNFDLNYNLAYLYEIEEKYIESYKYYKKSLEYCNSDIKRQILDKIAELQKNIEVRKHEEQFKEHRYNQPVISIISFIYNSKEYINECAESVLNQSFKDFEWVILDNGCTDGTSEILEDYAKRDKRIRLFRNEINVLASMDSENKNLSGYNDFTNYRKSLKSKYVALLDSDDFLHRDFLRYLYIIAKKNDVDIAVGGTEMFNDENHNLKGDRCPPTFSADDINEMGDKFRTFYPFFRPLWGKLIRTPIYINTLCIDYAHQMLNAGDTFACITFLKNSKSIASINRVLHYYRIRENSLYQSQVNKNRYLDYLIIYEESKKLLKSWNKLNDANLNFITEVLYCSMKDCIDIAAKNLKAPLKDRIEVITTILSDTKLRKILNDKDVLINLIDEGINALNIIAEENTKTI